MNNHTEHLKIKIYIFSILKKILQWCFIRIQEDMNFNLSQERNKIQETNNFISNIYFCHL